MDPTYLLKDKNHTWNGLQNIQNGNHGSVMASMKFPNHLKTAAWWQKAQLSTSREKAAGKKRSWGHKNALASDGRFENLW